MNTIEKGFFVLESLADFEFPVSLKLLAQKTKLPKPTLYRILQSLVKIGYVTQDGAQGNYSLSPKLAEVGNSRRYSKLKEAALPLMEGLHESFNETVNLGVLVGANVQYLHVLETTKPLRWIVRPGSQDSFYCTALGRAIVAFLPSELQDALISRSSFEKRTSRTPTDATRLRQILSETRQNGWALDDEENEDGVMCFAAPLFRGGDAVAAISVSIPKGRLTSQYRGRVVKAIESLDKDLNSSGKRAIKV
ncbi:MAG: IclR family transcriptional regulator [Trueperaceae bacterium]